MDRDALRLLVRLASLVTESHDAMATIEAVAETARGLLDAASLSISRRDGSGTHLTTLINVGDLAPGEERWPTEETYDLTDYPRTLEILDGSRHRVALARDGDPDSDPAEVALLRQLGKDSCLNAPIVLDGVVWGELYATRASGQAPFDDYTAELSEVVVGLIAAGVSRARAWQRMHLLATTDPLTGLVNRRAFDERFHDLLHDLSRDVTRDSVTSPGFALLLGDVNGLKKINDTRGHSAGDETLVAVARAAARAAAVIPDAVAARLGGDEFALLLPACGTDVAVDVARAWWEACADTPYGASLSVGVAVISSGAQKASEVFRRADAALYTAKRSRGGGPVLADD